MLPFPMTGVSELHNYEKKCAEYDDIVKMFAELGSGKLDRRDVLKNVQTMIDNGLVQKLEDLIEYIENYESWN